MIRTIPSPLVAAFILTTSTHIAHAEDSITEQAHVDTSGERKTVELSVYAGGLFPASDHNFHDEVMPHQEIGTAPVLGLRAGYFPLRFIGAELEAGVGQASSTDDVALTIASARAHLVLQLPYGCFTPFALAGAGRWWTRSESLGNDADPVVHFGIGAKYALSESIGLRVDLRDSLSQATDAMEDKATHHPEILVGLSFNIGGGEAQSSPAVVLSEREPEDTSEETTALVVPLDSDGDGVADTSDQCPEAASIAPHGCADADSDGVFDDADQCPEVAGIAPHGCADADSDGVFDDADQCPEIAGIAPHGCTDQDNDGFVGANDACPDQPETVNGFLDEDGCPDTKPAAVKQFEGPIKGIRFRSGKAVIRQRSHKALAGAIKVLTDYPSLRLRIHGHTDSTGTAQANLTLSEKRADAVRDYFIAQGIDAARIETTGHGATQPLDGNSKRGRTQERRIAFEIIR